MPILWLIICFFYILLLATYFLLLTQMLLFITNNDFGMLSLFWTRCFCFSFCTDVFPFSRIVSDFSLSQWFPLKWMYFCFYFSSFGTFCLPCFRFSFHYFFRFSFSFLSLRFFLASIFNLTNFFTYIYF